jgi:hypothetical protein
MIHQIDNLGQMPKRVSLVTSKAKHRTMQSHRCFGLSTSSIASMIRRTYESGLEFDLAPFIGMVRTDQVNIICRLDMAVLATTKSQN